MGPVACVYRDKCTLRYREGGRRSQEVWYAVPQHTAASISIAIETTDLNSMVLTPYTLNATISALPDHK